MRIWNSLLAAAFGAAVMTGATAAMAVPSLQLWIDESATPYTEWDAPSETWTTGSTSFSLTALAVDKDHGSTAGDAFFGSHKKAILSLALIGNFDGSEDQSQFGTINVGGTSVPGGSWTYGNPPLSDMVNPDLPSHGIFPTWYGEFMFNFGNFGDDVFQANAGEPDYLNASDTGYRKDISIDLGGLLVLDDIFGVHFDLYTVDDKGELYNFAPFSHDAEYHVSEPFTVALFCTGLAVLAFASRRRLKLA